eukprot:TRINITY_DN6635_c0_g1_i1.p1 TRINITY_DN6635_c0_g1~~TRINITY_DN6635_c0_g1_i1.p1  ORF type:complete len:674 (-),score=160.52 TRINITY_DN6635_c0_g1_i1:119-2140(-)
MAPAPQDVTKLLGAPQSAAFLPVQEDYPVADVIKAEAVGDYEPAGDMLGSQLRLKKGDIVYVLEQHGSGWWGGHKAGDELTAWFPAAYVRELGLVMDGGEDDDVAVCRNCQADMSNPLLRDNRAVAVPMQAGDPRRRACGEASDAEAATVQRLRSELAMQRQRAEVAEEKAAAAAAKVTALAEEFDHHLKALDSRKQADIISLQRRVLSLEEELRKERQGHQDEIRKKEDFIRSLEVARHEAMTATSNSGACTPAYPCSAPSHTPCVLPAAALAAGQRLDSARAAHTNSPLPGHRSVGYNSPMRMAASPSQRSTAEACGGTLLGSRERLDRSCYSSRGGHSRSNSGSGTSFAAAAATAQQSSADGTRTPNAPVISAGLMTNPVVPMQSARDCAGQNQAVGSTSQMPTMQVPQQQQQQQQQPSSARRTPSQQHAAAAQGGQQQQQATSSSGGGTGTPGTPMRPPQWATPGAASQRPPSPRPWAYMQSGSVPAQASTVPAGMSGTASDPNLLPVASVPAWQVRAHVMAFERKGTPTGSSNLPPRADPSPGRGQYQSSSGGGLTASPAMAPRGSGSRQASQSRDGGRPPSVGPHTARDISSSLHFGGGLGGHDTPPPPGPMSNAFFGMSPMARTGSLSGGTAASARLAHSWGNTSPMNSSRGLNVKERIRLLNSRF